MCNLDQNNDKSSFFNTHLIFTWLLCKWEIPRKLWVRRNSLTNQTLCEALWGCKYYLYKVHLMYLHINRNTCVTGIPRPKTKGNLSRPRPCFKQVRIFIQIRNMSCSTSTEFLKTWPPHVTEFASVLTMVCMETLLAVLSTSGFFFLSAKLG